MYSGTFFPETMKKEIKSNQNVLFFHLILPYCPYTVPDAKIAEKDASI